MSLSVGVIGLGAVGGLYASMLSRHSDISVHAVSRFHSDQILKEGISIMSPWGNSVYYPDSVVSCISDLPKPMDYLLICTKVFPNEQFHLSISSVLTDNTKIVLLQNGLSIENPYIQTYSNRLISGISFVCSVRHSPTVIEHFDYGDIILGLYPSGLHDDVLQLCDRFNRVGVTAHASELICSDRWKKLLWNASFNPISVLSQLDTQSILSHPKWFLKIKQVMVEVQQLAALSGFPIDNSFIDHLISRTKKMKPYKPSMLVDFENGRPMEIDAILGAAIKVADNHALEVPELRYLYHSLN